MVQVRVKDGLLEGEVIKNEYGGTYCSFKGIPYAQPPVGDLRFKEPQPLLQPWTGIRNATKFGQKSYQFDSLHPNQGNMSEDCLYLNVYSPDIKSDKLLPVMVWIHGGAFVCESGDDDYYGPEFLVRHGIVLVTFNYRLGALGFLCLDNPDIPGNAGMKDQVAALRWVKTNIQSFGGDPDNITIFGESAGGGAVSYHLISPMTRGLFRRAIAQSGAATCWWSQDFESREKSLLFAKRLGCFSEDDKDLNTFFKTQPVETLVTLKLELWKGQKFYEIPFGIVDEKDFGQERFFYGDITDVLRNGVHEGVEIITGHTKDEGYMTIPFGYSLERIITEAKLFKEFLVPRWIKTNCVIADQMEVGRKMREFYFKNGDISEESIMSLLTMDFFAYGSILAGKFYARNNKVYFYEFSCISDRNVYGPSMGATVGCQNAAIACHGDDLAYLFPVKHLSDKCEPDSESFKLIETMSKLWVNFAKYGNPTPDKSLGIDWKPYTLEKQEYLDLGNKPTMKTVPRKEEAEFWDSIFKKYLPQYIV